MRVASGEHPNFGSRDVTFLTVYPSILPTAIKVLGNNHSSRIDQFSRTSSISWGGMLKMDRAGTRWDPVCVTVWRRYREGLFMSSLAAAVHRRGNETTCFVDKVPRTLKLKRQLGLKSVGEEVRELMTGVGFTETNLFTKPECRMLTDIYHPLERLRGVCGLPWVFLSSSR